MSQTARNNIKGSVDMKRRQQFQEGGRNNIQMKANNFIEYKHGAFKEGNSNRIKTARVRGEHKEHLLGGGLNEDDMEGGDIQMMTSISSPKINEDLIHNTTARKHNS